MLLLLKLCLGLVFAAGVSSAVAVPVVMNYRGKGPNTTYTESRGGQSTYTLELSQCRESGTTSSDSLDLGATGHHSVCWRVESGESTQISEQEKYTQLFKDIWNKKDEEWNNKSYGEWTDNCTSSNPQWTVFSSGSDGEQTAEEQYLGLCNSSKGSKETPFIKKEVKQGKTSLWSCSTDCWKADSTQGGQTGTTQLQDAAEDKWKEVKFYKQS
ncbi:hypothetical protein [Candidatus Mycoplasma haematominutum]|uniref:Uncharacterized protein n=1 Tax=Candidatus Mycoplasma haematominutum 'Birmingham 1' TaxID=1116213 RepID=G8C3V3_9MOLU|nr:hypothetical protein [Candidatus Mycoplasma haematominutum]CCE67001.1 hypothetical protein MHM_04830 [Candidatus Mycoplasma haematominutum 'Birmingham 1']